MRRSLVSAFSNECGLCLRVTTVPRRSGTKPVSGSQDLIVRLPLSGTDSRTVRDSAARLNFTRCISPFCVISAHVSSQSSFAESICSRIFFLTITNPRLWLSTARDCRKYQSLTNSLSFCPPSLSRITLFSLLLMSPPFLSCPF